MSEASEGIQDSNYCCYPVPRDYINELDEAIQVFHSYPESCYEKKYYATVVCNAAIRLRESQK